MIDVGGQFRGERDADSETAMSTLSRQTIPALAAVAVYAAAVPWVFRPWFLAADLLPHTPGPIGTMIDADLYLNIWILAWAAHAAIFDPLHLMNGNIFHPSLNTIAGSENMFAHLPVTAPILALTGSALTMLKSYVLETFALSGLGMFLYVRHHTGNAWAALVAGAAFTFTPFRAETIPQPQYLGMAFLPLALLCIDLYLETNRLRWLAALAAALFLQALSCVYVGYFTFMLAPIYALSRLGVRHSGRFLALLRIGVAFLIAGVALIPAALPYLRGRSEGMIPNQALDLIQIASWPPWRFVSGEFIWRAGIVAVLLVAVDLLLRLRRERRPASELPPGPTGALWVVTGVAAVLAAGPYLEISSDLTIPLPYMALYEIVPGFSSVRVPLRFTLIIAGTLAALAGISFARISKRWSPPITTLAALGMTAAAIITTTPTPRPVMAANLSEDETQVYRWLAEQPGPGAVLEVPGQSTEQDIRANVRNGQYMVASSLHWRPLLNGYTAYPPPSAGFFSSGIRDLPDERALTNLIETTDLRWILLHRNALTPHNAARWPTSTPPGLERVAQFDDTEVYEVTRPKQTNWRAQVEGRMTTPATDSLEGTPRAPLPEACRRGSIVSADVPPTLALFPLARRIPVRIRNDSDCTWPSNGLLEEGLVGLDYRWVPWPNQDPVQATPPLSRLTNDVPPHSEVETTLMLPPPSGPPGPWSLELRLVQRGQPDPIATLQKPVIIREAGSGSKNTSAKKREDSARPKADAQAQ